MRIELPSGGFIVIDFDLRNTNDQADRDFVHKLLMQLAEYVGGVSKAETDS